MLVMTIIYDIFPLYPLIVDYDFLFGLISFSYVASVVL